VSFSIKWIFKNQLGWMVGAAFILIYTSAHAQVFVDASEAYRYVAPQEEHELKVEIAPPQGMPALMNPTLHESVGFVSSKTKVVVPPSSPELAKVLAPQPRPAVLPQPQAVISPKAVERPAPVARPALIEPDYSSAAVWAGETSQSLKWTKTVLEVVRANKRTLDRANDVENFCPGYRKSTSKAQEMCWVVVMSAITKLESSFNPETQAREGNGDLSVGLLAMSGHQCKNARTLKGLKNPIENLKCGNSKNDRAGGKRWLHLPWLPRWSCQLVCPSHTLLGHSEWPQSSSRQNISNFIYDPSWLSRSGPRHESLSTKSTSSDRRDTRRDRTRIFVELRLSSIDGKARQELAVLFKQGLCCVF
jgi:hypothetical protein